MSVIKKIIKNALNTAGYDLVGYTPEKRDMRFDLIYQQVLRNKSLTIFDVGAHRGESVHRFQSIFSNCQFHVFEPSRENFGVLHQKFAQNENIVLNQLGVGAQAAELTFHQYAKSNVSSFARLNLEDKWVKLRSQAVGTSQAEFEANSYQVPVTSLDDYTQEKGIEQIDILKIDTQGFEDESLKGCRRLLKEKKIHFIELELIVKGPYERKLTFTDIENLLLPFGYQLYGIEKGSNFYQMSLLQFDLLFVHVDHYVGGQHQG